MSRFKYKRFKAGVGTGETLLETLLKTQNY